MNNMDDTFRRITSLKNLHLNWLEIFHQIQQRNQQQPQDPQLQLLQHQQFQQQLHQQHHQLQPRHHHSPQPVASSSNHNSHTANNNNNTNNNNSNGTSNHNNNNHINNHNNNNTSISNSSLHNISLHNHTTHSNSNNNIIPRVTKSPKRELIDFITCKLCKGYLVDAVTLDLCMHSFCKTCALDYVKKNRKCPEPGCKVVEIKDKRFLNRLKLDLTLQSIVYKLVPGLYEKEMARRRKFYASKTLQREKREMFGDIPPSKTIKPHDLITVCITWNRDSREDSISTYLHCRADSTILILRKLITRKFGLDRPLKIYYGTSEIYSDLTTLMDVAVTFDWAPESKILSLSFNEVDGVHNR